MVIIELRNMIYDTVKSSFIASITMPIHTCAGIAQRNGDLRLMNGSIPTQHSGRLEVYDSSINQWGTICIEGFTLSSANTTCKQLGSAGIVQFGEADTLG